MNSENTRYKAKVVMFSINNNKKKICAVPSGELLYVFLLEIDGADKT